MKITTEQINKKLQEVMDPELNISIIDLGLIYKVTINKQDKVLILMTLTTVGCPLIDMIQSEIKNKIMSLGIKEKNIEIKLTFNPPWDLNKMTKKGKAMLGIG